MVANPAPSSPTERAAIITPPVGGWNTRDPLVNMSPEYAVELENFFPNGGSVDLRKGYTKFCTTNQVVAFGNFKHGIYDKLVAAQVSGANNIIDISSGTAVNIGSVANPLTISMQQFRDRLFITSYGNDDVKHWTGASFANAGFVGPGGDDKNLGPMCVYKNRLYFAYANYATNVNLPEIWYSATTGAITGALTELDLESILQWGGGIWFIGSVTRAKDFSEDELFVAISTEGEVLLYQGEYPGSASWGLVGHYFMPRALGPKSFFYLGSTLMVITAQGVIPISSIMGGNNTVQGTQIVNGGISDIISKAFTEAVTSNPNATPYLWTGINHPLGNYMLVNIPLSNGSAEQYVMNTITGAWCRFTGMYAGCWAVYQNRLYFGGASFLYSNVYRADDGYADTDYNTGLVKARNVKIRHAFNYLDSPTKRKQITQVIPTVFQSETLSITLNADVDYTDIPATSEETDTSQGTAYQIYQPTCGIAANSGNAVSVRIDGSFTTKRFSLQALKVFWDEGDIE